MTDENPGPVEPIEAGLPDPELEKLLAEEEEIARRRPEPSVGGWLPASSENQPKTQKREDGDIVDRLREIVHHPYGYAQTYDIADDLNEAADEIERLRAALSDVENLEVGNA